MDTVTNILRRAALLSNLDKDGQEFKAIHIVATAIEAASSGDRAMLDRIVEVERESREADWDSLAILAGRRSS